MGAPQLSSAFIDLATYGELESYMYAKPSLTPIDGPYDYLRVGYPPKSNMHISVLIIVLLFIIFCK